MSFLLAAILSATMTASAAPSPAFTDSAPTFADEFNGSRLDESVWTDWVPSFQGRSAGFLFARDNVAVSNGCLNLTARFMRDDEKTVENLRRGFTTYATAYVRRKEKSFYGYYECRAKTMHACVCNAFWLYDPLSDQPKKKFRPGDFSEEIDIFEIFGREGTLKYPNVDHICFETVHRMVTPYLEGMVSGGVVTLPNRTKSAKIDFSPWADFHVYGFRWTEKELIWYVDGKETFRRENDVFHRPLHLVFDCEIMYNWTGEPAASDLPSVFSIDYFRYWKEEPKEPSGALSVREARTGKVVTDAAVLPTLVSKAEEKGMKSHVLKIDKRVTRDMGLEVEYAVAFPESTGPLVWHHDMRTSREVAPTDGIVRNASRQDEVGSQYLSYWPFAVVTGRDGKGVALGLDPEYPAFYNFYLDAKTRRLVLHLDIGLAPEAKPTEVRFVEYPIDGKSPFRLALKGYYARYPKAFASRAKEHGLWMPFSSISKVKGWEDFGFKFKEGGSEPAWDKAHGIETFLYTEPTTWWQAIKGPTNAYDLAKAATMVATNREALAKAWAVGVFHDREGRPVGHIKDTPWCKGVVWNLNDAPGIAGETTGWKVKMAHPPCGEYVDSAEMYVTVPLDFNRAHFGGMTTPLCWDAKTGRPAIFKGMIGFEYVRGVAEKAHAAGRLTMANGTPGAWFWLAPNLDVLGTESDWQDWRNGKRVWTPLTDEEFMYRRALCGKKPFCFLMNTDFALFTPERARKYFERCLAYGSFPGFFSIDAASSPYFTRPELYERERPLYKKYLPLIKTISEAGWCPDNTLLEASDGRVVSEQFGDRYVTLFNPLDTPITLRVRFSGSHVRELVSNVDVPHPGERLTLTLPPETVRLYSVQ